MTLLEILDKANVVRFMVRLLIKHGFDASESTFTFSKFPAINLYMADSSIPSGLRKVRLDMMSDDECRITEMSPEGYPFNRETMPLSDVVSYLKKLRDILAKRK